MSDPARDSLAHEGGWCRIVVLHHLGVDEPHFDLMLEPAPGKPLLTWRCPHWPPTGQMPATRLRDHRNQYLTYEGPVAGDRGQVSRIYDGHCMAHISPNQVELENWQPAMPMGLVRLNRESGDQWSLSAAQE
jgi:hypothetical protein